MLLSDTTLKINFLNFFLKNTANRDLNFIFKIDGGCIYVADYSSLEIDEGNTFS